MGRRFIRESALAAFLFIFVPSPAAPVVPDAVFQKDDLVQRYESADAHFFEAEKFFLKQDFENARSELAECLSLMPEHSEAHYLMAQINLRQGFLNRALNHVVKAETYYDFASKIRGEQQKKLLLELQQMRDEQDATLTELKRDMARTSDPASRQTLEVRILQAQKIKMNIDDRLLSPLSLPTGGVEEFHFLHGEILVALKRYPEAEAQYRMIIETTPTSPDAYDRLARLLLSAGQSYRALEVINGAEEKGVVLDEKLILDVHKALAKKSPGSGSRTPGTIYFLRAATASLMSA